MNAIITKVLPPTSRSDWNRSATKFVVYTAGAARDVADREYFTKHSIGDLKFKCASWSRVGSFAAKIEGAAAKAAVEAKFGVVVELKFSRTAGCSCGCSPGFVGKIVSGIAPELSRADVWVKETISEAEVKAVADFAAKWAARLPEEIKAGNAKAEAETAARAANYLEREKEAQARLDRAVAQERKWLELAADESLISANL